METKRVQKMKKNLIVVINNLDIVPTQKGDATGPDANNLAYIHRNYKWGQVMPEMKSFFKRGDQMTFEQFQTHWVDILRKVGFPNKIIKQYRTPGFIQKKCADLNWITILEV